MIKESVRGYDLYLLVDVTNYSLTYTSVDIQTICHRTTIIRT